MSGCGCLYCAMYVVLPVDLPGPVRLPLAFMRCSYDTIGNLPRLFVVEGSTALTVVTGCFVSAHTPPVDLPQGREGAVSYICISGLLLQTDTHSYTHTPCGSATGVKEGDRKQCSQGNAPENLEVQAATLSPILGQAEGALTVPGKVPGLKENRCILTPEHNTSKYELKHLFPKWSSMVPEGLPGLSVALGTFQQHGREAGGTEHQDQVGEVELCLQV